jgi:hypothetical protein
MAGLRGWMLVLVNVLVSKASKGGRISAHDLFFVVFGDGLN